MTKTVGEESKQETDKEWFQIITILTASLPALCGGMLFAWSSPSIPRIVADKVNYDITLDEASYFTVLPPIGAVISCLIFSKTIDIFGRKLSVIFIIVPYIIAWILIAIAKSVYIFYIARFIVGIGDACMFSALPTYIGEIATPKVRGIWGNSLTFCIYFGQFLINAIGSYLNIWTTAYISLVIPIIFICIFVFMPESPYYLLMKDRNDEAKQTMQKLLRKEDVDIELKKLRADVDRQMSESGTWKDLVFIDSNRKALYAGIFLRTSQQLGGISSFMVYTQYIFLKSGGSLSATTSALIFTGLCCILNIIASFNLDKIGRRKSYLYSNLFCGLILLTESIYFYIDQNYQEIDLSAANWIPATGMIIYIIFYSFGLGIVPTLMLGELFSASIKGKGLGVLNIVFGILVSVITKVFHLLDSNVGLYAPFLLFAITNFLSTILSLYFVPETKGKTLEQIQQELKGKASKPTDIEG